MARCLSFTGFADFLYQSFFSYSGLRSVKTDLGDGTIMHCWVPKTLKPLKPNLLLVHGFSANAPPPPTAVQHIRVRSGLLRRFDDGSAGSGRGVPGAVHDGADGGARRGEDEPGGDQLRRVRGVQHGGAVPRCGGERDDDIMQQQSVILAEEAVKIQFVGDKMIYLLSVKHEGLLLFKFLDFVDDSEGFNVEVMDDEDNYTKDGTVDYQNWPANMKKTGTWKACPYILENLIFSAMYGQMGNLFLLQAEYMDTWVGASKIKIPEASLSIFDTISVIFWVPVYDRYIIPLTRKFTGHKKWAHSTAVHGDGPLHIDLPHDIRRCFGNHQAQHSIGTPRNLDNSPMAKPGMTLEDFLAKAGTGNEEDVRVPTAVMTMTPTETVPAVSAFGMETVMMNPARSRDE
ncbi:protein nrt1/ ptr family 8.2 [Phtheirospermum japonicum]|uniref:Protein nrt1/ ptr family 8.2 n=1 Tax=Phtheirospermum japonicum TaxID=374723 RepID=A0A830BTS8_9LAMI|nr:protein nrt1/ ptr family 8.2 [Phtheirospermum japonicum]